MYYKGLVATFGEEKKGGENGTEKGSGKEAVKGKDGDNDKD